MDNTIIGLIIYIIGFFLSIVFLSKYGKRIGVGYYDEKKTYVNHDDWDSNTQAWTWFSIFWPIFYCVLVIWYGIRSLEMLTEKIKKIVDEKI